VSALVHGTCDPRFAAVREAFADNLAGGREVGASFAATLDGRPVVDLWGGWADAARTRPWRDETIVNVFSTTKALTALCAHVLVDRGLLDLDAPVARYWPEFARGDKTGIPVRMLLSHTAGLAAIRRPLRVETLYDWDAYAAAIAAEAPWWEPGTANGYHAMTFGHLVGELVRRVSGVTLGRFLRDHVTGPLDADFHIGLPASEDGRCAEMIPPTIAESAAAGVAGAEPGSLRAAVLENPPLRPRHANTAAWRRAEIPAANGHGNARSVARVLSALACGGTVGGVRIARAIEPQAYARDLVLGFKIKWGLGFMLVGPELPLSPNPRAFGHGGWGGSLGFVDLDARVSWAYVMNRMAPGTAGDTRGFGLMTALYGAL
jgi:CubicO group peptidase (beta-lactamase class C family)